MSTDQKIPEWAALEARDLAFDRAGSVSVEDMARALAAAYARGREDAAKVCIDVGALCVIGSEAAIAVEACIHAIRAGGA